MSCHINGLASLFVGKEPLKLLDSKLVEAQYQEIHKCAFCWQIARIVGRAGIEVMPWLIHIFSTSVQELPDAICKENFWFLHKASSSLHP
jgi:hypothetical protein